MRHSAEVRGGAGRGWVGGVRVEACGADGVMMVLDRSMYDDGWTPCFPFFWLYCAARLLGFATVRRGCAGLFGDLLPPGRCRFGRCVRFNICPMGTLRSFLALAWRSEAGWSKLGVQPSTARCRCVP